MVRKLHALSGKESWEERCYALFDFDQKAAQLALAAQSLSSSKVIYIELTALLKENVPELKFLKPLSSGETIKDEDFSGLTCSALERV